MIKTDLEKSKNSTQSGNHENKQTLPKRGTSKSIGQSILPIMKKNAAQRGFSNPDILIHWQEIMGATIGPNTRPLRIKYPKGQRNNGTFYISSHPSSALLLQHSSDQIIEQLNAVIGYQAITKIRIVQNPNITYS